MAKLFYTIDEAAAKLRKPEDELRAMIASGQLEEFKMHDVTHFKKAVIDQLVVDDVPELNLDLGLDDPPTGESTPAGSGAIELDIDLSSNSGSAAIDELKFDDDAGMAAEPASGDASAAPLDIDLEDSAVVSSQSPSSPPPPSPSMGESDSGMVIGLADSAPDLPAPVTPKAKKPAPSPADSGGVGLGSSIGLDLGLEDSSAPPPAPPRTTLPSESGSGIALNDMSGSMSPMPTHQPRGATAPGPDGSSIHGNDFGGLDPSARMDDSADADASSISAALLDDGADSFDGGAGSLSADTDLFADAGGGDENAFADADAAPAISTPAARAGGPVMVAAEIIDGAWSGAGAGLMIGALASILVAALIVVGSRMSGGSTLASEITGDNMMLWLGGLAGGTLLCGGIGFFVGRSIDG